MDKKIYCICGKEAEKVFSIENNKVVCLCDNCAADILIMASKKMEREYHRALPISFVDSGGKGVVLGQNTCKKCNFVWTQTELKVPLICPNCKSSEWKWD